MRFLLVLLSSAGLLWAVPPFNYPAAVAYAERTTPSEIPKHERIYLFGPGKVTETYILNNAPATHEVEQRTILSAGKVQKISDLWKMMALDLKGKWMLSVYQAAHPVEPVFRVEGEAVFTSGHPLGAGDVVLVSPASRGGVPSAP